MSIADAVDIVEVCKDGIPGYDAWATAPRGWYFDEDEALRAIQFVEGCCTHVKGALGGEAFELLPWEQAIYGNAFGWKRRDGTRRYRLVWLFVPRGNGKSPIGATFVLKFLFDDDEPGAEIYGAAADRDQAGFVWEHAEGMIRQNPGMLKLCRIYSSTYRVVTNDHRAYYERISADAKTKHGMNIQFGVYDEVHCARTPDLMDAMQTAMRKRRQPMLLLTTTSDYERPSICNEMSDRAHAIRDGTAEAPDFLPIIHEATNEDDWTDPDTWHTANPNLGVSIPFDSFAAACQEARDVPRKENVFKRLHLNIRTEQAERWLQMAAWDACAGETDWRQLRQDMLGRPCYAGLDLSSTIDITALGLWFPDDGDVVLPWFWAPKECARDREDRDRVPYLTWAGQEAITLTPGNAIDYSAILEAMIELSRQYRIQDVGYDPWNATHMQQLLSEQYGFQMVEYRQGYQSMNAPTKELERRVTAGELAHGGHPVLRWMAGNVAVTTDPAGNLKPVKNLSVEKIDGIVALIMAIGRSMANQDSSYGDLMVL